MKKYNNEIFGAICLLAAGFFLSFGGLLIRLVDDATTMQVTSYRSITFCLVALIYILIKFKSETPKAFINIGKDGLLLAVILGLSANFLDIELPRTLTNTTSVLAGITIPLLLFTMGISLNKISYKLDLKIIFLIFLRILFAICIAYLITFLLKIDGIAKNIILLQAVLPAPIFTYLFASQYKVEPDKVAIYLMT